MKQASAIREVIAETARVLGISVPVGHTGFVLLRPDSEDKAQMADRALRADKPLARGTEGAGLPDSLRVTYCLEVAMDRILYKLKRVMR